VAQTLTVLGHDVSVNAEEDCLERVRLSCGKTVDDGDQPRGMGWHLLGRAILLPPH